MITYYVVGHWLGRLRTASVTQTLEQFYKWASEHGFTKRGDGVWRAGRDYVVVQSISTEDDSEI